MARFASVLIAAAATVTAGDHWAVIVAGSQGYSNYRHQADACHAYQVVRARGVAEEKIILMAYDDIAHNEENPFPGKIFNQPDPNGPGKDVYAGCNIDYSKKQVSSKTFLRILTGSGRGKVLRSTRDDHVFVFFADHGARGAIAFPSDELHKKQLQAALRTMHNRTMFKRLVFYLESCESGSMFEGLKVPNVYALSASNPTESSWGTYCDLLHDKVNGKSLNTCLGDLFSVSWLQDSEMEDTSKESLEAQFHKVHTRTNKSHVMQWGDLLFTNDTVSEYIGSQNVIRLEEPPAMRPSSIISSRHVDLDRLYQAYALAETSEQRQFYGRLLSVELASQLSAERVYERIAALAYPSQLDNQKDLFTRTESPDEQECEFGAHAALREDCDGLFLVNSGFALQFHQVIVNVCFDVHQRGLTLDVTAAAHQACSEEKIAQPRQGSEIVI